MTFKVTKKAMRPAFHEEQCFYCGQPIGSNHKEYCVLICKKALVGVTIEYEINVPAYWDKEMVDFNRNEGSWCASNVIEELKKLEKTNGCLCSLAKFKCLKFTSKSFLDE